MASLSIETWSFLGASLVLAAIGVGVLSLRRSPPAIAFTGLTISAAAISAVEAFPETPPAFTAIVFVPMQVVASCGLIALAILLPTRWDGRHRGIAIAIGVGAIGLTITEAVVIGYAHLALIAAAVGPAWTIVIYVTQSFVNVSFLVAAFAFPARARSLPIAQAAGARTLAILALGIVLLSAGSVNLVAAAARGEVPLIRMLLVLPQFFGPLLLWIPARSSAHGTLGRNVVLAMVAIYLAAFLTGTAATGYAIGRVLGALVLAYAVLRGQIEGLDLKVRFAISKSTIAAVFIAVFFLASEIAQQFFGATFGSAYVGIAAAGMLVFALAPLQRAAERLAERAVPISAPAPPAPAASPAGARDEREQAFRRAVRLALRDRELTREEERHLLDLAHHLGIAPLRAGEIQDEIAAEVTRA